MHWLLIATSSIALNWHVVVLSKQVIYVSRNFKSDDSSAVCGGLVNYNYGAPQNVSDIEMDISAKKYISDPLTSILPRTCQLAIKKAVCASVYQKCSTMSTGDSTSTTGTITTLMPCQSVCEHVIATCGVILDNFHLTNRWLRSLINCTGVVGELSEEPFWSNKTSSSALYYHDNNNSKGPSSNMCNGMTAMTATNVEIAHSLESYQYASQGGVCSGIVSNVFIPPLGSNPFSSVSGHLNIPPLSTPYSYQDAAETAINSVLSSAPAWVSGKCFTSLRSLLCNTLLMPGEEKYLYDELSSQAGVIASAWNSSIFNMSYFINEQLFDSSNATFSYSSSSSSSPSSMSGGSSNTTITTTTARRLPLNYTITVPLYPLKSLCTDFYSACGGEMAYLWQNETSDVRAYIVRACWSMGSTEEEEDEIKLFSSSSTEQHVYLHLYAKIRSISSDDNKDDNNEEDLSSTLSSSGSSATASVTTSSKFVTMNLTSGTATATVNEPALSVALFSSRMTVCPHGSVLPDDPYDRRNVWISGTGCAIPCRRPLITDEGYKSIDYISKVAPAIGLPLIWMLLFHIHVRDNAVQMRKNRFAVLAGRLSGLASIGFLSTKLTAHVDPQEALCHNNAIPFGEAMDGFTICSFQATVLLFTSMGMTLAWFAQTLFMFCRSVLQIKVSEGYLKLATALIILLPFAFTVYIAVHGLLGYPGNIPWCLYLNQGGATPFLILVLYYGLGLVCGVLGTFFLVSVVITYLYSTSKTARFVQPAAAEQAVIPSSPGSLAISSPHSRGKKISFVGNLTRIVGPTVLFNVAFLLIWTALLLYPISYTLNEKKLTQVYDQWYACMFNWGKYNVNPLDHSWKSQCGPTSYSTSDGSEIAGTQLTFDWVVFMTSGQSIIFAMVFLPHRFLRIGVPENLELLRHRNWMARMQSLSNMLPFAGGRRSGGGGGSPRAQGSGGGAAGERGGEGRVGNANVGTSGTIAAQQQWSPLAAASNGVRPVEVIASAVALAVGEASLEVSRASKATTI